MQEGTVKFYNDAKGYGFITPANGEADVFVHATGLKESVKEKDKVTFELQNGKKGLIAINVKLL